MYPECMGSTFTFAPKQSCWKYKANFHFTARQLPDTEQMNAAANKSIKSYIKTTVLSLSLWLKDTNIAEERSEGEEEEVVVKGTGETVDSAEYMTQRADLRQALRKKALWLQSRITANYIWPVKANFCSQDYVLYNVTLHCSEKKHVNMKG